jgi:glycosyltransferase involved in cell wall biosynthesis
LQRADAIIVLSENTRNDLLEMLELPATRVHVVRPPTDPFFFEPVETGEMQAVRKKFLLPDRYMLFVGTLEPRKNIPGLIKAFEEFCASHTDTVSLVIVGRKGWLFEHVIETIAASPMRERITILDYVTDRDLRVIYRSALMFVFPSFYEGHGFPVVEAMASGVPVIAANNSSLKEIAAGASLLVEATDTRQLAGAMHQIYTDSTVREELSRKGRERAAEFSVEKSVKEVMKIYDTLDNN